MTSDEPFFFERRTGEKPGVEIFQLRGPLTLGNLFALQDAFHDQSPSATTIVDFAAVPYIDSAGMGIIINHYVHCQRCGCKLIVAGVNGRVKELFTLTKVDTVIPMAMSVEEAESRVA
jgi:anti-sigma B factor antagonist